MAELMVHRHGFPAGTPRDAAEQTAVDAYRQLGGTAETPIIEHVDGDGELIVVVRTAPKPPPPALRRMDGLVIQHGDIPNELYEQLAAFLARR